MDREGVLFALTSSASSATVGQGYGNAEMANAAETFPDRLGMLIWINPIDPSWQDDATPYVERGALGIKLHPKLNTYAVDHESLAPVFAFARENRLPIVTHAETGEFRPSAIGRWQPSSTTCHSCSNHFNAGRPIPGILMAKEFPNVYVDTCFVPRERSRSD